MMIAVIFLKKTPFYFSKMFSGKRILITGAAGFIGRNLATQLMRMGADVHGTSRTDRAGDPLRITWWKSSFEDIDTVRNILHDVEPHIIFHLAGRVTGANDIDNLLPAYHSLATSTVNILSVASKLDCDRVLIMGSSNEPVDINPNSPYAAAKLIASMYGRFFYRLYDTPVVIARPFVGYGPGQPSDKLIPYVISQLIANKRPRLSSGAWRTDWIYIDDMVEGIIRCATTPGIEGCTIDIGTGTVASVREIVKKLVQLIEPKVMPDFGALADRFDEHTPVANVNDTWEKIGWKAAMDLDEGLKKTVTEYTRYKRQLAESLDR